jgi:hypothetical protein
MGCQSETMIWFVLCYFAMTPEIQILGSQSTQRGLNESLLHSQSAQRAIRDS